MNRAGVQQGREALSLPEQKAARLCRLLREYGRVAVAFSGGVDSSLLLHVALEELGAGNVLLLHGRSVLQKKIDQERAASWLTRHGIPTGVEQAWLDIEPLSWKEFVANPEDRCYLCKLRLYRRFREQAEACGFYCLVDGTNADDLKERRPGLRAIHELGVRTPLVEVGLAKEEIRELSRTRGLDTADQPSSSCLATRIPHGTRITLERLRQIEKWERGLEDMGLAGCRVKMSANSLDQVKIELQSIDLERIFRPSFRLAVLRFFQKNNVEKIFVDLEGRKK
ncbi:ATP-dependent sacrificial sulfur transferase LarE [Desulfolithobacter sp.]